MHWVHPTWRDLVIERLAIDRALRRRFLARCGLHGTLLALSVAGGADGQRRLPLIGSDEDWDAVGDRLYALVPELEDAELAAALTAIELAIAELGHAAAASEARALARAVLQRSAERWPGGRKPIPLFVLDAWLRLSRRLRPPSEPPSLAITWAQLLPARVPDLHDRVEVERFADWLALCEIVGAFSPRLLASLGGASERAELSSAFIQRVAAAAERESASDHVIRALEAAAAVNPGGLGEGALRLADCARAQLPDPPAPAASGRLAQEWVDRVLADL